MSVNTGTQSGTMCTLILACADCSAPDNATPTFISKSELDYLLSDGLTLCTVCLIFAPVILTSAIYMFFPQTWKEPVQCSSQS